VRRLRRHGATPKRAPGRAALTGNLDGKRGTARSRRFRTVDRLACHRRYRLGVAQNLLQRFYLETRTVDALPAAQVSVFAAA
jgi:xanthine dehydrogenase iron-sulfur cluster and FAD-binding subunit A